MANDYFQFKQFIVRQGKAALKVCTDACLFGAYSARYLSNKDTHYQQQILDIGTGTGLLSLMIAQKVNATINAIEIDAGSFEQASENFQESPWKSKLQVIHADTKTHSFTNQFDSIICNPPFFANALKSTNQHKNLSKHVDELPLEELAKIVSGLLKKDGFFFILLPYSSLNEFVLEATKYSLHLKERVNVRQTTTHNFFRTIGVFCLRPADEIATKELAIKDESNNYTVEFKALLKDYYLYL
jgi:tRNA1Val (adenine37-N6)-methyltransferase